MRRKFEKGRNVMLIAGTVVLTKTASIPRRNPGAS